MSAAGCKVESYWTAVFGSAFEGKDLLEILAAPGECASVLLLSVLVSMVIIFFFF